MAVILLLLAVSLVLGGSGLATFLWCLRHGQYDDMEGAANRILFDDEPTAPRPSEARSGRRPETRQGALPPMVPLGPPPPGTSARGQAPAEPLDSMTGSG